MNTKQRKKFPCDATEMRTAYQYKYLESHPWMRHYCSSKGSKSRGRVSIHTMVASDFKELWFRDKAFLLRQPSIDRIDPRRGYEKDNCRFIERGENTRRAQLGTQKPQHLRKLTILQVKEIKKFVFEGIPLTKLARTYKVTTRTIYAIIEGRTYRYVKI